MLKISEELRDQIRGHSAQAYPYECCGALLGRDRDGSREVLGLLPLTNRRDDSARNRFSITPEDVRLAEKTAHESSVDLIGWYHSHPDSPARPSEYDREHAWPWYSYIIVEVRARQPKGITSWRLSDDRQAFSPEGVEAAARARG